MRLRRLCAPRALSRFRRGVRGLMECVRWSGERCLKTRHGSTARRIDCHSASQILRREGSTSSRKHTFSKANGPWPRGPRSHSRASLNSHLRLGRTAPKFVWKTCTASTRTAKASRRKGSIRMSSRRRWEELGRHNVLILEECWFGHPVDGGHFLKRHLNLLLPHLQTAWREKACHNSCHRGFA